MTSVTAVGAVRPVRWLPGFVLLGAIWGASFLFIKIGVRELHPMYVTLGRVTTGAVTLLVVLLVTRDRLPRDPKLWGHLAISAAMGVALPFTLFGYGEQRVSSGLAGIWNAVTPLVVLPIAVLVFRTERMTARRAIGLLTGFAGVLVVLGVWEGLGGIELTGQLMCLGAATSYGINIPYMRRFVVGRTESGVAVSAAQLLLAVVQLAIVAPLVAGAPRSPLSLSLDVIGSVTALGALGTGLAFVINFRNLHLMGATAASTVTYVIPVFAVLIGVIALREHISWYQPVGAMIVLVGVAVSQGLIRARRRAVPSGLGEPPVVVAGTERSVVGSSPGQ